MKRLFIIIAGLIIIGALGYAVFYLIASDPKVSSIAEGNVIEIIDNQKLSEWREENRTGVSSETGLLRSWPEGGPSLIWSNLELPRGYSSPAFGNNTIYLTGNVDRNDVLVALDGGGNVKWQTIYGTSWNPSNPESRSTPTVEGEMVWVSSGSGEVACINGITGDIIWSVKASEIHKGTFGEWGIAESLLIDDQKVYFTPGGPETMTIALNKVTGELIWKSQSLDDKPMYVSPILIEYAGINMFVNISRDYLYGLDASNGALLWKIKNEEVVDHSGYHNRWPGLDHIKCVTPLYHNGKIYVTGGYDTGGALLSLSADGSSVSVEWSDKVLDVHHGGVVLIDGYLYGANWLSNGDGNWCCIEWATGEKKWEEHWKNKGSIIAADGLIYIYDERSGFVGLLNPNPEKFDLISEFRVRDGSGPYWAHPVIHNGVLFLRHGEALLAFDIRN